MKNKKALWIVGLLVLCCLAVVLVGVLQKQAQPEDRLTPEQKEALREEYPICGIKMPPLISMRKSDIETVRTHVETFVYGEVTSDIIKYNTTVSLENEDLADKRAENGIDDTVDFYEYEFTVLDDSDGIYAKGDKITISANIEFIEYNPQLYKGMKIIVPLTKVKKEAGRRYFSGNGSFYVTPDGYTIPVMESKAKSNDEMYSGLKVEDLLAKLKK